MNGPLFPDYSDPDNDVFSSDAGSVYYEINFQKAPNSINAETLIGSIDGLNDVFKAIAAESNINISFKIRAINKGSFEWQFELWPIVTAVRLLLE